jgi:hypothetical protein
VSIDDYEKAKAEKKAAIAAMMKKGDSTLAVDESAFASMKLGGDAAPENQFGLTNGAAKAKRERERAAKEKKTVATGFKTAPTVTDDRDDRGGRGGRGGRGRN